jgi:hypothetical protein
MPKTIDEFRQKFDPAYVIQTPQTVLRRDLPANTRRFIITAAQNGTPVHEDFWACLLAAAKHLNAEILVIPLRYKNPTSSFSGSQQNAEWWAPAVTPYLWNQRHALNANLTLMADFKIQPTAVDALAGMDGVSGEFSAIYGHTKLRLRSVATPQNKLPKVMTTTGACTVENYTDTRAGKVGEFHHVLAACLVELEPDGKRFHLRQLMYSGRTRRVIDLDDAYHVGGYLRAPPALAGAGGDTHVRLMSKMVYDARHREGGLIDTLRCQNWIEHDLMDAYSCNPHHDKNPMIWLANRLSERDSIAGEINEAGGYLRGVLKRHPKLKVHVAASNHDDMVTRAALAFMAGGLKAIPHVSPANLEFLGETVAAMAKSCKSTPTGTSYSGAFSYWLKRMNLGKRVHILDDGESLMIGGIEHGMHGDDGPNGARGSVRNLARIGVKSFTGHGHSEEIFEGAWRLGTGTELEADYTRGPGSWTNTEGSTNADGKRQLHKHVRDENGRGKFRL